MNDQRWDSLAPSDESFIDHALRAGREDLPDDARLRDLEGRLASALECETAAPAGWWHRPRWAPIVGLATLALAGLASVSVATTRGTTGVAASTTTTPASTTTESVPSTSVASTPPLAVIAVDELPAAQDAQPTNTRDARLRPQPSTTSAGSSDDELALLEQASLALDERPRSALALTDAHLKRFHEPKFAQERERLAVVALVRLGRHEDAKRRADAFEASFPESPHLARIRELVRP